MSALVRGLFVAALVSGGVARADELRLFAGDLTPATGLVLTGWSMSLGPGSVAGKVLASSITFSQAVDATTIHLLKAHARQTLIPTVVVEARATPGGPLLYRLTLIGARVTSLDVAEPGAANGSMQWSVKPTELTLEQLKAAPAVAGNVKVPVE